METRRGPAGSLARRGRHSSAQPVRPASLHADVPETLEGTRWGRGGPAGPGEPASPGLPSRLAPLPARPRGFARLRVGPPSGPDSRPRGLSLLGPGLAPGRDGELALQRRGPERGRGGGVLGSLGKEPRPETWTLRT